MQVMSMILICPVCQGIHEAALIYKQITEDISLRFQTCTTKGIIYLPEDQQDLLAEYLEGQERGSEICPY